MFWRRRKLPEDDDPLVPHGLISQAMEHQGSELPPDMWDSPKDVEQSPAQPVEMRLRVSTPAQERLQEPQPLAEQGRISPPLKWPLVDEAEIARRAQGIDTAVSFPYRKPIVSAAVPEAEEFEPEVVAEPAKLELVESPAAPPIPTPQSQKFANLLSRFRDIRLPSFSPVRQRIALLFSQAKTSASSGFQLATNQLQEVRSKSGAVLDTAKVRVVKRSQAAVAQSRLGLQHLREGIRAADLRQTSRAWDRVRSWQVTVRIPASNKQFFSSLGESAKASRVQLQQTVQRDSRLWASLGMGALSALLALGFISAVRHYAPDRVDAQPTSIQATTSAAPMRTVQSNSLIPLKHSAVAEPHSAKPSPAASAGASKQVAVAKPSSAAAAKQQSVASPKKPRTRRNTEEADYVAKDSYVYYGNSGKPSR